MNLQDMELTRSLKDLEKNTFFLLHDVIAISEYLNEEEIQFLTPEQLIIVKSIKDVMNRIEVKFSSDIG